MARRQHVYRFTYVPESYDIYLGPIRWTLKKCRLDSLVYRIQIEIDCMLGHYDSDGDPVSADTYKYMRQANNAPRTP